jgi:hypothetical protein
MSVTLEIEDGNPWYLSPNLWVVPGDDPEGPPGMPIAGTNAYLWARVRNTGSTKVDNATVNFYWANPAVGVDRNTATPVGTAYVTLDGGQTSDVLCLVPWVPVYVNQGHECILAEAFHPVADPLPTGVAFNVPTDRHVAQRNLAVLKVPAPQPRFHFAFEIHNPGRQEGVFNVNAAQGRVENVKRLLPLLGRDVVLPQNEAKVTRLGFVPSPCPTPEEMERAVPQIKELRVKPGGRVGYSLVGTLDEGAALVHVEQRYNERLVGGLSLLLIRAPEAAKRNSTKERRK